MTVETEAHVDSDVEIQARTMGWKPKEEFDGPEGRWRSAEDFVEFNDRAAPLLKKQRDEYAKKLAAAEQRFQGYEATVQTLMSRTLEKERADHKASLDFLKAQLKQQRIAGNTAIVAELEEEIDKVKEAAPKEPPPLPKQQAIPIHPDFYSWAEDNPWVENDPKLKRFAIAAATQLREEGEKSEGMAFFRKVEKIVKEDHPEKFQTRRTAVESPTNGAQTRATGTTYSSLPADAKAACDSFVEDKLGSREDYIKLYNAAK